MTTEERIRELIAQRKGVRFEIEVPPPPPPLTKEQLDEIGAQALRDLYGENGAKTKEEVRKWNEDHPQPIIPKIEGLVIRAKYTCGWCGSGIYYQEAWSGGYAGWRLTNIRAKYWLGPDKEAVWETRCRPEGQESRDHYPYNLMEWRAV